MSNSDQSLIERAQKVIPGGVNSPVRAFKGVGGNPVFIARAEGPYVYSQDNRQFIDYVGSWGPMILGHTDSRILEAIGTAAATGTSFGAPTSGEIDLAEELVDALPAMDMVRLVNSGTEACMTALRLARAYTGRDAIIKFAGCYHGHGDCLLVKAGSGAATFGVPSSSGVPKGTANDTLVAPYNDLAATRALVESRGKDDVAAIILEPVAGNMGVINPAPGFLEGLRKLCDEYGIVLIVDEVMTGFRVAWGGAQRLFIITPDLSTFGKVIGGGLPLAAFGGKRKIMECLAPLGTCYQAGTLSGNPLAVAAGLASLRALKEEDRPYERLEEKGAYLEAGLRAALDSASVPGIIQRQGSMVTVFFTDQKAVTNFDEAAACDHEKFGKFFHKMLENGVALPPSGYESWFISLSHDKEILDQTIEAAKASLAAL
ncbi:MAG: glutamate-1-semialdehyde 2,1-aminomutase [Planctomycetota bacterium]|nr:glutamate-1-semialdehyde 2,1-aminomutase [Planctomycetota bacterium]